MTHWRRVGTPTEPCSSRGKLLPDLQANLLVEPRLDTLAAYEARTAISPPIPAAPGASPTSPGVRQPGPAGPTSESIPPAQPVPTRYFATAELDAVRAAVEFGKIQNELIGLFTSSVGAAVKIRIDIEAENADGFDETVVRAAKENGRVLGVEGTFE